MVCSSNDIVFCIVTLVSLVRDICMCLYLHFRPDRIKCPICRKKYKVPSAGVSSFPPNRIIVDLLNGPTIHQPHTPDWRGDIEVRHYPRNRAQIHSHDPCYECRRHQVSSRCHHCDMTLCDSCRQSHMELMRRDLNQLVSKMRSGMPAISNALRVIENKSKMLTDRAERREANIANEIERYISKLKDRRNVLQRDVQVWLDDELKSLCSLHDKVELELASTTSFCDRILKDRSMRIPDKELVDMKRQCVRYSETIQAYENGIQLPHEKKVCILV